MTEPPEQIPSFSVLGVRVHLVRMGQVLDQIQHWVETRDNCRYIVNTGMHGVMEARRSPDFKRAVDSADLSVPEGISLIWAARSRGFKINKRVSGPDLMWEACKLAEDRGHRFFFYGDTEETLARLTLRLKDSFPRLNIVGVYSPPFRSLTQEEDADEIEMINASGADIVWVALGVPKQERWMFEHRDKLNGQVLVGVGAAFKFLGGQVKRAPPWVGDHGFEWLWRLVHEPRRIWRRVLLDGPHFFYSVALENFTSKRRDTTK